MKQASAYNMSITCWNEQDTYMTTKILHKCDHIVWINGICDKARNKFVNYISKILLNIALLEVIQGRVQCWGSLKK